MFSPTIKRSHLNAEFVTQHKALFESKLAKFLFQNPQLFKSVKKVSDAICNLVDLYSIKVEESLKQAKVQEELSDKKYFCRFKKAYDLNTTEIPTVNIKELHELLCLEKQNLCQVMQTQAVFIHRIFPEIIKVMPPDVAKEWQKKKENLVNLIFTPQLFSDRARIFNNKDINLTNVVGISSHPVFSKLAGEVDHHHARAMDQFSIDKNSSFYKNAAAENIPIIAGPSGHTGSLLLGAMLYGNLNPQELWEYSLACFAFLTTGGHHSFHEVMLISKQAGIDYIANNYQKNIPPHLAEAAKEIIDQFPQYFSNDDELSYRQETLYAIKI